MYIYTRIYMYLYICIHIHVHTYIHIYGAPGHPPKRLATYTSNPTSLPASSTTPPTVSRISGRGDLCGCLCELYW